MQNDGTYTDSLVWLLRYSPAGNEYLAGMKEDMDLRLWPNPASASSEVSLAFNLDEPACLQVSILTTEGRTILDIAPQRYPAGQTVLTLPADRLAPGLYLVLLQGNGPQNITRLVIN